MDSASCCGDTSALTLAMSQPKSSAYRTLAMASLEQRWCLAGWGWGGRHSEGEGHLGLRREVWPHLASTALSTVRGVKIFSRIVSCGGCSP